MNRNELNKIIDTLTTRPLAHTVLIDNVSLDASALVIELIHSDESGEIENETIAIRNNGTIIRNGKSFITPADLLELPQTVRNVLAMFVVAMRDGEVHGDNPELELISANKQFFLDNEEAFVPAGVLCAAGVVDEHNMEVEL